MIDAGEFAPFIGFTEEEVRSLCAQYNRDFREVKRWYDGYLLEGHPIYNPKAVTSLMLKGKMPAGKGHADLIFLPKRELQEVPALVVELKWDKTAEGAMRQIMDKKYFTPLIDYAGEILMIGINYNKKTKRHECVIRELQ